MTRKPVILASPEACTSDSALKLLSGTFNVSRWSPGTPVPEAIKPESVVGIWVRHTNLVAARMLPSFTSLRFIATTSTGVSHIDPALTKAGIRTIRLAPDTGELDAVTSTVELTWALILEAHASLSGALSAVEAGQWQAADFIRGIQLSRAVMGIVGFGRIGSRVAKVAEAFGMRVIACDSSAERRARIKDSGFETINDIEDLFRESHFVSLHVPSNADTYKLIDEKVLTRNNKPHLVNTSRGEVVYESAILGALRDGLLLSYSADVASFENTNHRLQDSPLWVGIKEGLRIKLTPHIGGASSDAMELTEQVIARKVMAQWQAD